MNRLAFLAANLFARITNAFAFVRFGRVIPAYISRNLTDHFLVRALDGDLRVVGDGDFDVLRNRKQDRVRESQTKIEVLALNDRFETNAFDFATGKVIVPTRNGVPDFTAQPGAEKAPTVNFNFGSPAPAASPAATTAATP